MLTHQRPEQSNNQFMLINDKIEPLNILVFRSDTRPPSEIFDYGFQRQGSTWEYYNKNKKILEPSFRFFRDDINKRSNDILRESAISFTQQFDCAPIFPTKNVFLDSTQMPSTIWIYIVRLQRGFRTYDLQNKLNSQLMFCKEVATRDVSSQEVIAAIKCKRFWNLNPSFNQDLWTYGMHYCLIGDLLWNPKLKNEIMNEEKLKINEQIIKIIDDRKDQYILCSVPQSQEELEDIYQRPTSFTPIKISSQAHSNWQHLIQFALHLKAAFQDENNSLRETQTAINHLMLCSDINAFIPNIDRTPLMLACELGCNSMITYLLSKPSIKRNLTNSQGKDAYDFMKYSFSLNIKHI